MKRFFMCAVLLSVSKISMAEVAYQARVQTSLSDYEFSINDVAIISGNITDPNFFRARITTDYSFVNKTRSGQNTYPQTTGDTLPMLGIGGTAILENGVFFDIYLQKNLSGDQSPSLTKEIGDNPRGTEIREIDIDREDYAFSVGKSFGQFSLSAGYKSGSTDFDQGFMFREKVRNEPVETTNPARQRSSFDLDGPFISLGYGTQIGEGVLSAKLAVADLTGEWNFDVSNERSQNSVTTNLAGDATGTTFSVSWKSKISEKWDYSVSADYYSYDFDVSGTAQEALNGNIINSGELSANVEEEILALRLGFIYKF